jgi:HKD family nuclease
VLLRAQKHTSRHCRDVFISMAFMSLDGIMILLKENKNRPKKLLKKEKNIP